MLLLPAGRAFLYTLFATWFAGAVCVPVAHKGPGRRPEAWLEIFGAIVQVANPRIVVGTADSIALLRQVPQLPDSLKILSDSEIIEKARKSSSSPDIPIRPKPEDTAHIQFSSGSTGAPKGILIRHEQILKNVHDIGMRIHIEDSDRFLSWLPLHHDMGFIGGLFSPFYWGIPQVLIPTESFMRSPQIWLNLISDFRATLSPAPAFAYELLATRIPDKRLNGIDLSSWRYAWIGAEPIFKKTLDGFTERFQRFGFQGNALAPCYGLAEATLAVTLSEPGAPPNIAWIDQDSHYQSNYAEESRESAPGAIPVVGVGTVVDGFNIRILDQKTEKSAGEREEGRIFLRGACVTQSMESLTGKTSVGEWLDTGDLGFFIGNQLFITGREKDLMIRGGVNIHPHWIEKAAESVSEIRAGKAAAFSSFRYEENREEIFLVVEPRRYPPSDASLLKREIQEAVVESTGFKVDRIEFVPPGSIPKTTSGKIQRRQAAKLLNF